MDNLSLSHLPNALVEKAAINQIVLTNDVSEQYVLSLTETDAKQLVATRNHFLKSLGRVEIGGGIIDKLILAFCDSPYLWQGNYTETLNQLVGIFYIYKEETLEQIGDEDLIDLMKDYFDNRCMGSVELLLGRELDQLAHNIRFGLAKDADEHIADFVDDKDDKYDDKGEDDQ